MIDGTTLIVIAATFILAGTIKGIIGLGLPSISLAILTVAFDLPSAMALMLLPSLASNLWQAAQGGNGTFIISKVWPFLLAATLTVWIGAIALSQLDFSWLAMLLGVSLCGYSVINLAGFKLALDASQTVWAGPLIGVANGILTGMTGAFVFPGVLYLQAVGFNRDQLIQAMGILFTLSTIALGLALQSHHLLSPELGLASGIAILPALLGMKIGQTIRINLSESIFRRVFFIALLVLGFYIFGRAAMTAIALA